MLIDWLICDPCHGPRRACNPILALADGQQGRSPFRTLNPGKKTGHPAGRQYWRAGLRMERSCEAGSK
ncbi:MAG: hypothetical protein V3S53_01740 [Gammaproteobacteria bacterium]